MLDFFYSHISRGLVGIKAFFGGFLDYGNPLGEFLVFMALCSIGFGIVTALCGLIGSGLSAASHSIKSSSRRRSK